MLLRRDSEGGPARREASPCTALQPGPRVTSVTAYQRSSGKRGVDGKTGRGERSQDLDREAGLRPGGRKWSGRRGEGGGAGPGRGPGREREGRTP